MSLSFPHGAFNTPWEFAWAVLSIVLIDIVLAVAGASKGHFPLLLFGLGLSISLVVFTSNLLAKLMDRYPAIIYVGAAILGKVGGGMIITDRLVEEVFQPARWLTHAVEGLFALGVILVALGWRRTRRLANH